MRMTSLICRSILAGAALAACMTPVLAHAQSSPAADPELAGIRIGMTEAEARAAIRAFDPALAVTAVMGVFNYNDGVSHALKTPEFLDRLEARKGTSLPSLKVYFSGPVGEVRVVGIHRNELITTSQPTAAQFAQGLIGKYGRPSGINGMNNSHLVWEMAGRPSCIRARDHANKVALSVVSGTSLMESSATEEFFAKRGAAITARGLLPADLAQCGAYVDYNFIGDPVGTFVAELNDLGAMITAERSRTAWVGQLQAEAVRRRLGQGQVPKL